MQIGSERFLSLSRVPEKPRAHPGYAKNEARVAVFGEDLVLHFLREEDRFMITLYADCPSDGDAPAVELGSISAADARKVETMKVLVYENREFKLSDTRALRKIL